MAPENLADDALLAAARAGNAAALETLLVRYQPRVYRFGVKMCGNAEDAGDVVQDTLLAMARSVREFRGDSSVATWLYTIARRFCVRNRRRGKFAPAREDSLDALGPHDSQRLADPAPSPEQQAAGREIEDVLTQAIRCLEPAQREVLLLRDVEGLTAPEVARVLGISVQAVKSRLHRARRAVREQVAPAVGATPAGSSTSCPDVVSLLSQHLEGDIAPEVCARMESHVAQCERCRDVCESLKRTLAQCRAVPAATVPATVANRVREAIRDYLAVESRNFPQRRG
jgi:RNA polymerase sigma-70 factor (ECF subfamily)